jgi:RNA polymerase sigma-70 factor (ECF subfamily)
LLTIDASHLLTDQDPICRAQSGDPVAVDALITAVRAAVLRYCRTRLSTSAGGRDTADDVTQETCAAVVRALSTYQHRGAPFAAFVYAIAANKVADTQRRFSRSPICVEDLPDLIEPSPSPEEQAIISARFDAVHELLDRLPERMRDVLLLRAAGASAEAVGDQLGMSANAVRVAQYRAAARLRQLIESCEEHREFFDSTTFQSGPAA